MELQHSYAASRKLWRSLRVAFFIARKGLTTKRKLIMEAYAKALRKYTHLIMLRRVSSRSTARPPPAGHSFRLWERCDEHSSISNAPESPTFSGKYSDSDNDEELDHEVSRPVFGLPATDEYSSGWGCTGDANISSAGVDEDERIAEDIYNRAEEFIRKFYEELRAQSHDELSIFM